MLQFHDEQAVALFKALNETNQLAKRLTGYLGTPAERKVSGYVLKGHALNLCMGENLTFGKIFPKLPPDTPELPTVFICGNEFFQVHKEHKNDVTCIEFADGIFRVYAGEQLVLESVRNPEVLEREVARIDDFEEKIEGFELISETTPVPREEFIDPMDTKCIYELSFTADSFKISRTSEEGEYVCRTRINHKNFVKPPSKIDLTHFEVRKGPDYTVVTFKVDEGKKWSGSRQHLCVVSYE